MNKENGKSKEENGRNEERITKARGIREKGEGEGRTSFLSCNIIEAPKLARAARAANITRFPLSFLFSRKELARFEDEEKKKKEKMCGEKG